MAPPAKSSKDTQEKDLMLDKDMEKDTWNFKSMADDDPMDFGFEPTTKHKKNAFKMDMSFDLDGDFGNISSFKMDMPDFDFSSPAKKTTKTTNESSDDKSSGNVKTKKDLFGFSYDFNGLDDFNLDSSPRKKGSESKTNAMDREEPAGGRKTDKSDALDFDLDLSPPKKGSETKTKTMDHEKNSAGRKTDKSDAFNFDLDLSPPTKESETQTKAMDREEIAAGRNFDKSDASDCGLDLPLSRQAASKAKTVVKANASDETENQVSTTTDTMVVDNSTQSKQLTPESSENSEALESPQSPRLNSSKTHMMHLQPQSVNTSPVKSSRPTVKEIDEPCLSNETAASSPSHASEAAHAAVNREISPDIHEICRSGTIEDCSRDPQNAYNELTSTTETTYEKLDPDISSQLCLDKTEPQQEKMGADTQAEIQDLTRRTLRDPDTGHSRKNLSGKISPGTRSSQTAKIQDSSAILPLAPSHSPMETDIQADTVNQSRRTLRDPAAGHSQTAISGKILPDSRSSLNFQTKDSSAKLQGAPSDSGPGLNDLKATQSKESGIIRSRYFKKAEQPESHVLESSPALTESRPVTRETKGSGNKDASPGSETRRCPLEPVNTDSGKNAQNVNVGSSHEKKISHKDHSNAKAVEQVTGLLDRSKMQAKNTSRERSMLQINISSKLDSSSLTQKLSKHLSSGVESLQKSKIVPLERVKLGNSMSDLRAAKTQRTGGVNKDPPSSEVQPEVGSSIRTERNIETPVSADMRTAKTHRVIGVTKDQPSSAVQPEVISSIRLERKTEAPPVKKISEIHQMAPREKSQTLLIPSSLKRKAPDEDADNSLTPQFKRFSMSPRENRLHRNVEELTHRLAQGKFQESRIENNTTKVLVNDSPRIKSHHLNTNMANVEIPITENNDNVEKAEAYTKELENICNILKKKHEEVKELLVRAVVNNNKLLMLNHPLYEDKIRMVQDFAAKLTLNEQQMMQT